jgi:TRAP-type mannitol/chloroaromatic compound transport system permease small subunit
MELCFKYIKVIEKISDSTGKAVSCLVYLLLGGLTYEVFSRYLFNAPTIWAFDLTYMLFGTIFMLGAPYTLFKKGHIRTDIFYSKWSARRQGMIDALMYLFLFFPGMIFYLIAGWDYAALSWVAREKAQFSPWSPIIYPFKTVIPVTAALLLLQGGCEFIKSVYAWKRGEWK